MATKTEKLDSEILNKIRDLQNNNNTVILNLGQIHLRERELNEELRKLQSLSNDLEKDFDTNSELLNTIIKELDEKYGESEIDLAGGTITFTEK